MTTSVETVTDKLLLAQRPPEKLALTVIERLCEAQTLRAAGV